MTDNGAFHQSWYAVALASELGPGGLVGKDFLGTRIVLWRDAQGAIMGITINPGLSSQNSDLG